jgi:hypothetical protein
MALLEKALQDITESDLSSLIGSGEAERKILEFKTILPGNSDDDKREFLADVTSFANASGGHIIFGMAEDGGLAIGLPGFETTDIDADKLRLENILRDGCQPRIPGLAIETIRLVSGSYALIISVPQSWMSPHIITFKNWSRFFSRNSAGKYQLDIQEIRQSVLASESLTTRIRNFHLERLSKVVADETPVPLPNGAKIVMHLIPVTSFQPNVQVDIKEAGEKYQHLVTLYNPPHGRRYNLDGLLTWNSSTSDTIVSYSQLFRSGIIETIDSRILRIHEGERRFIPSSYFESKVMDTSNLLLGFQKHAGITPPIYIFLSLSGVMGYTIEISPRLKERFWAGYDQYKVDRNILTLPEVSIDILEDVDFKRVFRNMFDAVWNAAGWSECLDYDENGNWIGD